MWPLQSLHMWLSKVATTKPNWGLPLRLIWITAGILQTLGIRFMSKAFLASVLQESLDCTGVAANRAAASVIDAIVHELKTSGGFTLPSFGTFTVKKTKARKALNPRTGEPVKVRAGKTVRFKASPSLKKEV
jgi:DNA-binding protein HU-beta